MTTKAKQQRTLPLNLDVERLHNAFPEVARLLGQVIPHEQIESILHMRRTDSRYRGVLWQWRNEVEQKTGIWIDGKHSEAIGVGFMVLAAKPLLMHANRKREQAARTALKSARRAANANPEQLTTAERRLRDHIATSARSAALALMEAPPPFPPAPKPPIPNPQRIKS